jgi:16S rRNA processing protein RimM
MNDLFQIGRCLAAHGIKGGFRFLLENTEDSVLEKGFVVFLKRKGQKDYQEHKIKSITFGHRVIVYLEGIDNRNQVEELLPFEIYIKESDLPREEDEVYLRDLIGMELFDFESGEPRGQIEKISSNGVQDLIVYKDKNNKRKELPLIEQFFPEIDLDAKKVMINEPDYV